MTFFVSKYPILAYTTKDDEQLKLPAGTIFIVLQISGTCLELLPASAKLAIQPTLVDAAMLQFAFTEQDRIMED